MKFDKSKGNRVHRYFFGVEVDGMWWSYDQRKWVITSDGNASSIANCRTLRAFKRMLRRNPQIKGRARLINNYIGVDVYS
jgi:hypothetical protein